MSSQRNLEERVHRAAGLGKLSRSMLVFQEWARAKGLKPSETDYLARTRGPRRELQFSVAGHLDIEKAYRTHYVSHFGRGPPHCPARDHPGQRAHWPVRRRPRAE